MLPPFSFFLFFGFFAEALPFGFPFAIPEPLALPLAPPFALALALARAFVLFSSVAAESSAVSFHPSCLLLHCHHLVQ